MADPIDVLRAVFRLEAERTVQLARMGREPGAEEALEDVDERLSAAMAELERQNIAYPLHMVARQYQLGQEDYLVIQLALLHRHGEDVVKAATSALGEGESDVRLSHAVALLAEGYDDWEQASADLMTLTVFTENLVTTTPREDGDFTLSPSAAVMELLGLE